MRLQLSNSNSLYISRTILAIMLVVGVYTFFDKEPMAAKLLAAGGSAGFVLLLVASFLLLSKSHNRK